MNTKEIIKLYTKDMKSTYEIAKLFNTYPNKIRRILIKNNIEIKDKIIKVKIDNKKLEFIILVEIIIIR